MSKKPELPIKTRDRGKKDLFSNLSDRSDFVLANTNLTDQGEQSPGNRETAPPNQWKESEEINLSAIPSGEQSPDTIKTEPSNLQREQLAAQRPISNAQSELIKPSNDGERELWDKSEENESGIARQPEETYIPHRALRGRKPGPVSRQEQIKLYEKKRSRTLQKIGPRLPAEKVRILKAYCATEDVDLEDVVEEALDLWSTGKVKDPETGQYVNWWSVRAETEGGKSRNG